MSVLPDMPASTKPTSLAAPSAASSGVAAEVPLSPIDPAAAISPTALLPHRPPFLFVDDAQLADDGASLVAQRRFDPAEPYFAGHFPGDPIVPGVILTEMMAQAANLLLSRRAGHRVVAYLVGVEDARFNRTVRPGDTVRTEVRFAEPPASDAALRPGSVIAFRASGTVNGQRCMRALVRIYHAGA